jgi:hypothetical protein
MTTRKMTIRSIVQRPHTLATVALAAAIWLTVATAADAQGVATATPNNAGKASRLHWEVDGTAPPISGQIPRSLTMSAPPGFTLNTAAVAKRCKPLQAQLDECPRKSRIGTAELRIHVEKPSGPRDLPVPVTLYLGRKNALMAVAFLAGPRVVPGSISGSNGITVRFDPLPTPPPIPQVSYSFLGVTLDLRAHRTITRKASHKTKGKKARRGRKIRFDLVKNPPNCASGTWAFSSTLGLPDGTAPAFTTPVACSG